MYNRHTDITADIGQQAAPVRAVLGPGEKFCLGPSTRIFLVLMNVFAPQTPHLCMQKGESLEGHLCVW